MLFARLEPWHWWLGLILLVVSILAVVGLIPQYLNKVVRPQHPTRRQRRQP